jgi:transposase
LRWCDAPWEYSPSKILYNSWKRWSDNGVFAWIMMGLASMSFPQSHRVRLHAASPPCGGAGRVVFR